ncbi:hypothetical protein, partial [Enterobacter cloacae complex sp. P24RS]|uniref:hypothetical protein n=1 Tax=Enterobacter cloacae complex sp. P24RS TaxID=2779568 RepID=UPI0018747E02
HPPSAPSHASIISVVSSSCNDKISIPTGTPLRLTPHGNVIAGRPLMAASSGAQPGGIPC